MSVRTDEIGRFGVTRLKWFPWLGKLLIFDSQLPHTGEMTSEIQYSAGHSKSLDGFRGAAILLVLLFHLFAIGPLAKILHAGWIGVDLFFVLSGFLITGILCDTRGTRGFYRHFALRRALRIFPLYYFALAIVFGTAAYLPELALHLSQQVRWQEYYWTYTQNLWIAFNGWPVTDSMNHFWSLAVEEQFYLVWPLAVARWGPRRLIVVAVGGVLLAITLRNVHASYSFAYVFTLCRADAPLLGALAAILIRVHPMRLNRFVRPVLLFSFFSVVILAVARGGMDSRDSAFVRVGYTLIDLFFACLLILSFDRKAWGRVLRTLFESRALCFLGRYSYGLYVYHWLIYRALESGLHQVAIDVGIETVFGRHFFTAVLVTTLSMMVSMVSFHVLESPFLLLKRRLTEEPSVG